MNLAYFQMLLQESIDNATSTLDFLTLSQALEKLNLGQIRTVSTYALLPDVATNEGVLVWVTADERLYWSTGEAWYSIVTDNRASAFSWGSASQGGLGTDNLVSVSSPVSVVGGFSDWCDVEAGFSRSVAVRSNSSMWTWGSNTNGELGNNSTTNRSSPMSVVGGFTDWYKASTGNTIGLAIRANRTAWSWGNNNFGTLGDGTTTNKSSPVSVVGGFSDWCQVSASSTYHATGIRTNGSAWAWGGNGYGQLGDGTVAANKSSPVSVVGGFTDWCQIDGGNCHTVAVRTNGSAWAWGANTSGRLGDNTTTDRSSPVSVTGGFTNWCQASAGYSHSVAIRTNSSAWSWGRGINGQMGDNSSVAKSSPVSVVGGFSDWCQIHAGFAHTVAVRTSGSAWSWGCNAQGRLGDNATTDRSSPVSVMGGSSWCKVTGGLSHSLALSYDDFV